MQLPWPIYSHGMAYLPKQLPLCAAGNSHLARGRSWVRSPAPAGALCTFFLHPRTFPTTHVKVLGLLYTHSLGLTKPNRTKSYRDYLQNMLHVVLSNCPSLSTVTKRLTCINNSCGVSLGTLPLACGRSRVQALAPAGALRSFFFPASLSSSLRR